LLESAKTAQKRKRKLQEVIAEIPSIKSLQYTPLRSIPREPLLKLPESLDIESPYALFTLFFTEKVLETIASSTNEYAARKRAQFDDPIIQPRTWKKTNPAEIKDFLGILIYMGVHQSPQINHYFQNGQKTGPSHLPQRYITQTRFEQLKRFLHVSKPEQDERRPPGSKDWWHKLEPLASIFHESARSYYIPGSQLSVDEIMVRCFGRTSHTYKMPDKPIKQEYKIFALAEHGYIWTFSWSSRQLGIQEMFKWPGLTPTGSIVADMINRLPKLSTNPLPNPPPNPPLNPLLNPPLNPSSGELTITTPVASYSIYIDNYFSSVTLFNHLHIRRYGACGTARPKNGVPPLLQELKDHAKDIQWNSLYAIPVQNVLCLAWQDNNIVFSMSTLYSADSFIPRKRKRPGKTSTNALITRRVFGKEVVKELDIPIFINDYNHYMNGVDLANQYRASYEVHLRGYRNWLPLFYWFINASVVNAWRIQYVYKQQQEAARLPAQLFFRERLYQQLLAFASEAHTNLPKQRLNKSLNHRRIQLPRRLVCVWCQYKKKKGRLEVSKALQSFSGCSECSEAALCLNEFHSIERLDD
jgi:hypothetical protein